MILVILPGRRRARSGEGVGVVDGDAGGTGGIEGGRGMGWAMCRIRRKDGRA